MGAADRDGPVIEARDVVKRYETEAETILALAGVSIAIEPGEFVAIMGPSGSGKSTLLNVLGLLDEPTEGAVYLDGEDTSTLSETERTRARKRTIGFIFQNFYLIPTLTARENVEIPRLLDQDPETPRRAAELLTRVGLGDRLDHTPGELSGGQKQRVAIARSLVNDPRLLLADEPTGNLDRETGRSVLQQFQEICDEGVAVVAVTHDAQVTDHADRTVTLVDGRISSEELRVAGAGGAGAVGTTGTTGEAGTDTSTDAGEPATGGSADAGRTDPTGATDVGEANGGSDGGIGESDGAEPDDDATDHGG